jgi:hypothetical protein
MACGIRWLTVKEHFHLVDKHTFAMVNILVPSIAFGEPVPDIL